MNKLLSFLFILIIGSLLSKASEFREFSLDNYTINDDTPIIDKISDSANFDYSNYQNSKRICLTDSNCNCKTIASTNCALYTDDLYESCYKAKFQKCETRCNLSRRCYRLDCLNAGVNRCRKEVDLACTKKYTDQESISQCLQKETQCCQRYELSSCKKARRIFRSRVECDKEAEVKCQGYDGIIKCNCIAQTRKVCLNHKKKIYLEKIRKFFSCNEAAEFICSEKKCGTEYYSCLEKEKSNCQPYCEKQARILCQDQSNGPCYDEKFKVCRYNYRKHYCEERAKINCGEDEECYNLQIQNCTYYKPKCFEDISLCDDNNLCTRDICNPQVGCINTPISCNDNNACTSQSCDPVLGCIYKQNSCDDAKICTIDSCSPYNGTCFNNFDISNEKCKGGPCQTNDDCKAWANFEQLNLTCQTAVCDQQYGACVAIQKPRCAEVCKRSCFPYDACDSAQCVYNSLTQNYNCVHTKKVCNDNKFCTTDSCNPKLGCVFQFKNDSCAQSPVCDNSADCQAWEKQNKLVEKCQRASCDKNLGVCIAKYSDKPCDTLECVRSCIPYNQCETAKCVKDDSGKSYCARTRIVCDDRKECTEDTCDVERGCISNYIPSKVCPPEAQCAVNTDCKAWGISQNLTNQCLQPVCNLTTGACSSVPIDGTCKIKRDYCQYYCKPTDFCDNAVCVQSETGDLVCTHSPKNCNDSLNCTIDTCDKTKGCVHYYNVSDNCPPGGQCSQNSDCIKFSFLNSLPRKCQKAVCDLSIGACKAVPKERKCISIEECQSNCISQNGCDAAKCSLNSEGDYICYRVQKSCDDNKTCTYDYCDINTGKCVNNFVPSANCTVYCNDTPDCAQWGIKNNFESNCLKAYCNQTSGSCYTETSYNDRCHKLKKCKKSCFPRNLCETADCTYDYDQKIATCQYSPLVCNDSLACTVDTCDNKLGCQFTYNVSKNCPSNAFCTPTHSDCSTFILKNNLTTQCLDATCDKTNGKCVIIPSSDLTCVTTSECIAKCKPKNACETVHCERNPNNTVSCISTVNTCDDNKTCTLDSCDIKTGTCVNKYIVSNSCPPAGYCEKNLDCQKWAINNQISTCQTPICNSTLGSCQAIPNANDCPAPYCAQNCETTNYCQTPICRFDINNKLQCEFKRKNCNDNNDCTTDSCDPQTGCKNIFDNTITGCQNPKCNNGSDCSQWSIQRNLTSNCKQAFCDSKTSTCRAIYIDNPQCNPSFPTCVKTCVPKSHCESAQCIVDGDTNAVECRKSTINCDDGNNCTTDVCDPNSGCKNSYVVSNQCPQFCKTSLDCAAWGVNQNLSLSCQVAICNRTTTSCQAVNDTSNLNCKNLTTECQLLCKPYNACDQVSCIRKSSKSNRLTCVHSALICNDNKTCTKDSCNIKTGCNFVFQYDGSNCLKPCNKDLDCTSWAVSQKLSDKCQVAVCDNNSGSCKAVQGPLTSKCNTTNQCKTTFDCPQSNFGTVCCVDSGLKKCCDNKCKYDTDCPSPNKNEWGYCVKNDQGVKSCTYIPICKNNTGCDDHNPCTKDVCIVDYGFCRHTPQCLDNTLCHDHICIPSSDKQSFTCKNPKKTCTKDPQLVDKNFNNLTPKQQSEWLGQCSPLQGCVTCVVNSQCDDQDGCTIDSCVNQFCTHVPIGNEWCDPELEGQPIRIQNSIANITVSTN